MVEFGPSSAYRLQGVSEEEALWGDGPGMAGLRDREAEDAGRLVMNEGPEGADHSVRVGGDETISIFG